MPSGNQCRHFVASVTEWTVEGEDGPEEREVSPLASAALGHPGLLVLHQTVPGQAPGLDAVRWRMFAAALSPRLDPAVLAGHVHRDDLKLFCFLHYCLNGDEAPPVTDLNANVTRNIIHSPAPLTLRDVRALVASHFGLRNYRVALRMGWRTVLVDLEQTCRHLNHFN